ncbi:hypothetical protein [Pseudogemmobacter bohemicus]|uniref:hypothetical protein n=1 Tax=Pseudogemmobacter bohemicus TaxID=2250708 RepID=UPI000DD4AF2C|nr:hypothetical protein [Pseudogemmobacter bohemicus]
MQFRRDLIRTMFAGDGDQLGALGEGLEHAQILGLQMADLPKGGSGPDNPFHAPVDLVDVLITQIAELEALGGAVLRRIGRCLGAERCEMRHEALFENVGGVFRVEEPDAEHGDRGHWLGTSRHEGTDRENHGFPNELFNNLKSII